MKKTSLSTVLAVAAFVGASFGQETPAPTPDAVPQVAAPQGVATNAEDAVAKGIVTNAEGFAAARVRLAELKTLPEKTTLLCGTSLQFPYYHFAIVPSSTPHEIGEMWKASFDLLAAYALGDADLAAEMFAAGAIFFNRVEDDDARQELMRMFQFFGEQAIERTSQNLCKDQPAQVVPYLKQLIATKAVTAQFGDKMATIPAGPLSSVRPEFLGMLVRNLQPVLTGDGADTQNVRAFEATVIDFLTEDGISADVRDALLDALLAPAFARASAGANAFRQLLADVKGLRTRLPNEASQTSLDERIQAFGERLVAQTCQALSTNSTTAAVAYLQQLAATRAVVLPAEDGKGRVAVSSDNASPLRKDFLGQLLAQAYPRVAGVEAPLADARAADGLVLQLLGDGLADETAPSLLAAFVDTSIARAQTLEGARLFVESAEKIRATLGEGTLRDTLDRRCRQFARRSTVKTFQELCPARAAEVLPYLQNLSDTLTLRLLFDGQLVSLPKGTVTAISVDLVGQLAEDALVRLAGPDTPSSASMKYLKDLLVFTGKLLPRLSESAQETLQDRRLDAFFLTGDFDGALALLDKGLPSHSAGWCKGTAAKLRYHRLLENGKKGEALQQLLLFIDFMLSDEQKDFEDCDPTTGIIYSREWVIARNYVRCWEIARDLNDSAKAAKYLEEAKKLYATALEKAKDDPKALAELKKEMQSL